MSATTKSKVKRTSRKCKQCRSRFEPKFANNPGEQFCCQACRYLWLSENPIKITSSKHAGMPERQKLKKPKPPTNQQLKRAAETAAIAKFNRYIVVRDTGKPCISCDEVKPLECGHFRTTGAAAHLRFDPQNAHGQCNACNSGKSGNIAAYTTNLIKRFNAMGLDGAEVIQRLKNDNKPRTFTLPELRGIKLHFNNLIDSLNGGSAGEAAA